MKKISKIWLFVIITFILSYTLAGIHYLVWGKYEGVSGIILGVVYMFMPLISSLVVTKIHGENIKVNLLISFNINKWFLVAWMLPFVLAFLTFAISLPFPSIQFSPDMSGFFERLGRTLPAEQVQATKDQMNSLPISPLLVTVFSSLIAGITLNAVAAFGEEAGWRGFFLTNIKDWTFFKASLIIGFIWGLWHAPLIVQGHNYPEHPILGIFMMIIWCILLTPLFIYTTIKAKSVIAAAVFHGTLNASYGLSVMYIQGGNDLLIGMTGLAGFIALIILIFVLFLFDNIISKEKLMLGKVSDHLQKKIIST